MTKLKIHIKLITLLLLCGAVSLQAQLKDSLVLYRSMSISGENPLQLKPGAELLLAPGVSLLIEGNINLQGAPNQAIKIRSLDPQRPAAGLVVKGQAYDQTVELKYLSFVGLSQPLRFEPFWQRKEVILEGLAFKQNWSGDPSLYVAEPLIDRRLPLEIIFKAQHLHFRNNASGMWLEGGAEKSLTYELDQIFFSDNYLPVGSSLLHMSLNTEGEARQNAGLIRFIRNRLSPGASHISLVSSLKQSLNLTEVESDIWPLVLFDQSKDPRTGVVQISRETPAADAKGFEVLVHEPGFLKVKWPKVPSARKVLLSEQGDIIESTEERNQDTLSYRYQAAPAFFITTISKGQDRYLLPPVDSVVRIEEMPQEDTLVTSPPARVDSIAVKDQSWADLWLERLNRNTQALATWEVGLWGGGAVYGAGDIKPKFAFIDDFLYVPSTVDWSLGLYAQYNINTRFSAKLSFYHSTISIHDLSSVGVFSGTAPLYELNENLEQVIVEDISYDARFLTHLAILDAELLWHLRPNRYSGRFALWDNLVPTIGVSVGALHYTPYRTVYTGYKPDESYWSMLRRHRDRRVKLRDLGTEGQNFIPGLEPYSSLALQGGLSFSLSWLFNGFTLKGEVRGAYTSTDYLDDFGPGIWWGGNRQAVVDNAQVDHENADYLVPRAVGSVNFSGDGNLRSVDGLNDWYFQGHFGISFELDRLLNKNKTKEEGSRPVLGE